MNGNINKLFVPFYAECFQINFTTFNTKAPDQNRTDTSSLEGYGSTIELQAQRCTSYYAQTVILMQALLRNFIFFLAKGDESPVTTANFIAAIGVKIA